MPFLVIHRIVISIALTIKHVTCKFTLVSDHKAISMYNNMHLPTLISSCKYFVAKYCTRKLNESIYYNNQLKDFHHEDRL